MLVSGGIINRYAVSDGKIEMAVGGTAAVDVTCGDAVQRAAVSGGVATLTAGQAVSLMPTVGVYELVWGEIPTTIERVGSRYCTRADVVAYGKRNGDDFCNERRYPPEDVQAAIQAAEEAIENGTRRSFCRRSAAVHLLPGLNELPVEDVTSSTMGQLLHGRQVRADAECDTVIVYGAMCDRKVRDACTQLAASYLRPRVGAENVRGQSMDGVYVSYTLATGEEGGETGLPEVDAVIASHRSRRSVVM